MYKRQAYKVSIAIVILLFILILAPRVYQVYELHEQITQAELRKEQLVKEKQELDMKKKELNDSRVIEDKARHELGLEMCIRDSSYGGPYIGQP